MMPSEAIAHLERALGHNFRSPDLLAVALTHRSYTAEHPDAEHYERLEFLGDAVLELATTRYLFAQFPDASEGEMAKVRAAVVAEPALAEMGRKLGVPAALRLGRGEEQTGGRTKDSIISDVVEALLAVVYLDAGLATTESVIERHWGPLIDERAAAPGLRDYKTRLQERLARTGQVPVYAATEEGPEHAKVFTSVVTASDRKLGIGIGSSKKRAEQAAAEEALAAIATDEDA